MLGDDESSEIDFEQKETKDERWPSTYWEKLTPQYHYVIKADSSSFRMRKLDAARSTSTHQTSNNGSLC